MDKLRKIINHYLEFKNITSLYDVYKLVRNERITKIKLFGRQIEINSSFWFLHGLREIFIDNTYKFNSSKENPKIIDCGANIGLSLIYFKKIFPKAEIIAFEPDRKIFQIMEDNLRNFRVEDIKCFNKAIWKDNGTINFESSGGVGGRINSCVGADPVECQRLKDLLDNGVDFLKIDIEGAEYEVIRDCAEKLNNVENIFIEYHSMLKNEQKLDEILLILKNAGFKYYIKEAWNNQQNPYVCERKNLFDLQLNIFGYRI